MQAVKTEVEIDKMHAEIAKIRAETRKILRESVWVPFVAGSAVTVALTGLAVFILNIVRH